MGACFCKGTPPVDAENSHSINMSEFAESEPKRPRIMEPETLEELIREILQYTSSCQDSDEGAELSCPGDAAISPAAELAMCQAAGESLRLAGGAAFSHHRHHALTLFFDNFGDEDPPPLQKIAHVSDTEEGWCDVMMALVRTVPLHDPLGQSAIALVFDYCPLPARDTIVGFTQSLHLTADRCAHAYSTPENTQWENNILFLIGCFANKFGTHGSVNILTPELLNYLITFLVDGHCPHLSLASLVALEKLAGSVENKKAIDAGLASLMLNPLLPLAVKRTDASPAWRCVGFAACWALDNIFIFPGRQYTFETISTTDIHVMLNTKDMTSFLKIGPDGLEARCDSHTFESVRATHEIFTGRWYYEVEVMTAGVMQIGWATKDAKFESHEGYGVGDDEWSIAYDGCRRLLWHNARASHVPTIARGWQPGDILGCLADTERGVVEFSVNGIRLPVYETRFITVGKSFYAAASLMSGQQCYFNFGSREFSYAPILMNEIMNFAGRLTTEQKIVVPRPVKKEMLMAEQPPTGCRVCSICFDREAAFAVEPCRHSGFCPRCVLLLVDCPLCRRTVDHVVMQQDA